MRELAGMRHSIAVPLQWILEVAAKPGVMANLL
jgi:hypothetical protein